MAADTLPVTTGVLRDQRRPLLLWGMAVAGVTAMYVGFWPAMGEGAEIEAFIQNMPEALVQALGYDQIATPAGYLRSTIYGLLAPVLLLVFTIGAGARMIAGQEEDGTLELELTAPVARRHVFVERVLAMWVNVIAFVAVVTAVTLGLVAALDIQVGITGILTAGAGLLLLVLGFGTLAMAVGAATGRRTYALAAGAGSAFVSFIFDAIGPAIGADWMTAMSPFSWYIGVNPLVEGISLTHVGLLAALPLLAGALGLAIFDRRDLMV